MADAPTLNGMVIGQAEAATRAVLDSFLAANGASFLPWVMLTLLARAGGKLAQDELVAQVRRARKLDAPPVVAALDQLLADGHVRLRPGEASLVEVTPQGLALHQRLRAGVEDITARLYRDLPAEELATAARILMILIERANAELTRDRTS